MSPEDLAAMLSNTVVEWLAQNDYLDLERPDMDWNKWRDSLAQVLGQGVTDPFEEARRSSSIH